MLVTCAECMVLICQSYTFRMSVFRKAGSEATMPNYMQPGRANSTSKIDAEESTIVLIGICAYSVKSFMQSIIWFGNCS